jgi:hypothetical protein
VDGILLSVSEDIPHPTCCGYSTKAFLIFRTRDSQSGLVSFSTTTL